MNTGYQVLLYYLYVPVAEPEALAEEQRSLCERLGLLGRILVAREGINGTVSGQRSATEAYVAAMRGDARFRGMEFKIDAAEGHVFPKLSVKARSEVVALGLGAGEDLDPKEVTGGRLSPGEWEEAMRGEDVIVIDGRNNYESALGRFKGAVCPDLEHFRDFAAWVREHKGEWEGRKVLTYCTGGIRCEKLSGLLLREGVAEVYQLDGGIINYGQDPQTRGRDFEGLCYVFDERVAVEVNHTETRCVISQCRHCGGASARYRNCAWPACNAQIFCCEGCEERVGRYCGETCREGHRAAAEREASLLSASGGP